MALALLPVAHGLDRYFDLFGERGLREPAARPHLAHELRRIPVVDGFLGAVRQDFHDPPVSFQAHPHHGRISPSLVVSANALPDSRWRKVNAAPRGGPYRVFSNISRPISMRRISDVPAPISYSLASRSRRPVGKSL